MFTYLADYDLNLILGQKNASLFAMPQIKKGINAIILGPKFFLLAWTFVESQPYFQQKCLQGEIVNNEAQFWETDPLPTPYFLSINDNLVPHNQEIKNLNMEINNLSLLSIETSHSGGEILERDPINPIVYTRRGTQRKNKDLPASQAQNHLSSPCDGSSNDKGKSNSSFSDSQLLS